MSGYLRVFLVLSHMGQLCSCKHSSPEQSHISSSSSEFESSSEFDQGIFSFVESEPDSGFGPVDSEIESEFESELLIFIVDSLLEILLDS